MYKSRVYLLLSGLFIILLTFFLSFLRIDFGNFFSRLRIFKPQTPFQLPAEPTYSSGRPKALFLANYTGQQVSLLWLSEKEGQACVYWQDKKFVDDRGESVRDLVHQVTVGGLQPETEINLQLCGNFSCQQGGGDWYGTEEESIKPESKGSTPFYFDSKELVTNGKPLKVKTGSDLIVSARPNQLLIGRVIGISRSAILLITLTNNSLEENSTLEATSSPLAVLIEPQSQWAVDLANVRTQDNQAFFEIKDKTSVKIRLIIPGMEEKIYDYLYEKIKGQPLELKI